MSWLKKALDYLPFGKVLRSFNNTNSFGYQGSKKEPELGDNHYTTHFRGLDVDIARWKQFDPKWNQSETPYSSMGNNPVMNNDPLGDTIVVNFLVHMIYQYIIRQQTTQYLILLMMESF